MDGSTPSRPRIARFRWPVAAAALAAAVLTADGAPLTGQELGTRVQAPGADRIARRLQTISPRSGPPGTTVTVASGLMPHITPVRVGMGATRIGFEALAELLTSPTGEFSVDVAVPEWARWDRNHRFILFDFYFNPIAASDLFFVTDAEGRIRREGRIAGPAGSCRPFIDSDGERFTLVGDAATLGRLADGDAVTVTGTLLEGGECGAEPSLRVLELQATGGGGQP